MYIPSIVTTKAGGSPPPTTDLWRPAVYLILCIAACALLGLGLAKLFRRVSASSSSPRLLCLYLCFCIVLVYCNISTWVLPLFDLPFNFDFIPQLPPVTPSTHHLIVNLIGYALYSALFLSMAFFSISLALEASNEAPPDVRQTVPLVPMVATRKRKFSKRHRRTGAVVDGSKFTIPDSAYAWMAEARAQQDDLRHQATVKRLLTRIAELESQVKKSAQVHVQVPDRSESSMEKILLEAQITALTAELAVSRTETAAAQAELVRKDKLHARTMSEWMEIGERWKSRLEDTEGARSQVALLGPRVKIRDAEIEGLRWELRSEKAQRMAKWKRTDNLKDIPRIIVTSPSDELDCITHQPSYLDYSRLTEWSEYAYNVPKQDAARPARWHKSMIPRRVTSVRTNKTP